MCRHVPLPSLITAVALLAGCGSGAAPAPEPPAASVNARYFVVLPMPVAAGGGVEPDALENARGHLARLLARTGGVPRDEGSVDPTRPTYVFHVTVGSMEAHDSGRTRASVTTVVRTHRGGRIVGALRGTATAYVERDAPLAERQSRAIEGALEGALGRLPELLARLEQR